MESHTIDILSIQIDKYKTNNFTYFSVALFVLLIFLALIVGFVIPILSCCKLVPGCLMYGNKHKERVRKAGNLKSYYFENQAPLNKVSGL